MKNPFIYGKVVSGKDFFNREEELSYLTRISEESGRVFLISPRRYGKTSLLINLMQILRKKDFYVIYLDLYRATTLQKFVELYLTEISRIISRKIDKAIKMLRKFISGIKLRLVLEPDGSYSLELGYRPTAEDVSEIFDEVINIPQKIARKDNKKFVVIMDEFQEIANYNGEEIEKKIRSHIQHHDRVAYIFSGSRKSVIYQMIESAGRAFYKMGDIFILKKLPEQGFKSFIKKKFEETGVSISKESLNEIINLSENYPYNVQFLSHKIWEMCKEKRKVTVSDVNRALITIVEEQSPLYLSIWDNLTVYQRKCLIAITKKGGKNMFSMKYLEESGLGVPSSLQTALKLLMDKGIIDKSNSEYHIEDVFFKHWIRYKIL